MVPRLGAFANDSDPAFRGTSLWCELHKRLVLGYMLGCFCCRSNFDAA